MVDSPQAPQILRAWLVLDGEPPLVPSAYAKPSSLRWEPDLRQLSLELNPCPERSALQLGRRWRTAEGSFTGLFKAQLRHGRGQLQPTSSGYSLNSDDLNRCQFHAYCDLRESAAATAPDSPSALPPAREATPIAVRQQGQVDPQAHRGMIAIAPGGHVIASPDLLDKTIWVRVTYPQGVVLTDDPVGMVSGHLLLAAIPTQPPTHIHLTAGTLATAGDQFTLTYTDERRTSLGDREPALARTSD